MQDEDMHDRYLYMRYIRVGPPSQLCNGGMDSPLGLVFLEGARAESHDPLVGCTEAVSVGRRRWTEDLTYLVRRVEVRTLCNMRVEVDLAMCTSAEESRLTAQAAPSFLSLARLFNDAARKMCDVSWRKVTV